MKCDDNGGKDSRSLSQDMSLSYMSTPHYPPPALPRNPRAPPGPRDRKKSSFLDPCLGRKPPRNGGPSTGKPQCQARHRTEQTPPTGPNPSPGGPDPPSKNPSRKNPTQSGGQTGHGGKRDRNRNHRGGGIDTGGPDFCKARSPPERNRRRNRLGPDQGTPETGFSPRGLCHVYLRSRSVRSMVSFFHSSNPSE